jgi:hypothetical protein
MRILLVAYEFPPAPSPQSLRWAYLGRELVRAGHEVHVLTAEPAWAADGLPELPQQMVIHRTSRGPIAGVLAMLATRNAAKARARAEKAGMAPSAPTDGASAARALGLPAQRTNWKGRLVEKLKAFVTLLVFPDMRGEWRFPARRAIDRLMAEVDPDVVVSSHEPATTLELGIYLKRRYRVPWLADLGDPVLADYTPERWRRRALKLEREVLRLADGITVTAPGTQRLLLDRHGPPACGEASMAVLSQGFDDQGAASAARAHGFFDPERLELLYTGSFYQFRRADNLLDAIAATPGARLNVATSLVPGWMLERFEAFPEKFRSLGFMPHRDVIALQRQADVLVNVANDNPCQVPGKVYEYFGAGRPILHTGNIAGNDVSAALIRERRRGWVCGSRDEVAATLRSLVARKAQGGDEALDSGLDLGSAAIGEFGWSRLGQRLAVILAHIARDAHAPSAIPAGQEH